MAYTELANKLEELIKLLDEGDSAKVKEIMQEMITDIRNRRIRDTQKTLNARRNSRRQRMLHNLDNKYRYALKNGNEVAAKKYLEEKEMVRKTIFD